MAAQKLSGTAAQILSRLCRGIEAGGASARPEINKLPVREVSGHQDNAMRHRLPLLAVSCAFILIVALVRTRFLTSLVVGDSMLPTFEPGDLLIVDKHAYQSADPKRGDLVIARYRNDVIVKRVVGLPGEEIEITEGWLVVNGTSMPEAYVVRRGVLFVGQGRVSGGKFAIVGDNRALSGGALVAAIVPKERIIGKVVFSVRLSPRRDTGVTEKPNTLDTTETAIPSGRTLGLISQNQLLHVSPCPQRLSAGQGGTHGVTQRALSVQDRDPSLKADLDSADKPNVRHRKLRTFFCHSYGFGGRSLLDFRYAHPS